MSRMMGQMRESLERNPATGFRDFTLAQEREALSRFQLTRNEEQAIGEKLQEEYLAAARRRGYRQIDPDERTRYLESLVSTFHAHMANRDRYPRIQVGVIDCPVADGQSFPGGMLIFTTGLLDSPDEATVAGVVAHELAHLDLAHNYYYAKRARLQSDGFVPRNPGDLGQLMTQGAGALGVMMNPYRPEDELAADCTATTWMFQEGYDPRALARFFEALHDRQQDERLPEAFANLRSHPYSLDRRTEVQQRQEQLVRWRPRQELGLYAGNLQRRESRAAQAARERERERADR